MSTVGMKTASERLRQLSASSPASSRASGGARVCRGGEVEEGFLTAIGRVFIGKGMAQRNYAGAPGGSHLRGTWQSCNTLRVVPCSHARQACRRVVLASPDFNSKDKPFKIDLMFVSFPSAD